jgi:hypothetical protein
MTTQPTTGGMTAGQAKAVEYAIITLCVAALVMIFQPFSLTLFSLGCVLVVVGGLAFNLVPLCRPGVPARALVKAAGIILLILLIVAGLGMLSAYAYVLWLGGGS